jgi:hypothetical protein
MPRTDHPGGYRFLPGISPYLCGVRPALGFEISHMTFRHPVAQELGFELIGQHLNHRGEVEILKRRIEEELR